MWWSSSHVKCGRNDGWGVWRRTFSPWVWLCPRTPECRMDTRIPGQCTLLLCHMAHAQGSRWRRLGWALKDEQILLIDPWDSDYRGQCAQMAPVLSWTGSSWSPTRWRQDCSLLCFSIIILTPIWIWISATIQFIVELGLVEWSFTDG